MSSHFEDMLRDLLNTTPGLSCDFPHTAEEKFNVPVIPICDSSIWQASVFSISIRSFTRSEAATAVSARSTSSRKIATNKVRDDAVHLIVGFEHEARKRAVTGISRAGTWSIFRISK